MGTSLSTIATKLSLPRRALRRARKSSTRSPEPQVGLPVEVLVGLLEQQHVGVVRQGEGQVQLLPGAARQFARRLGPGLLVPELVNSS